MGKITKDDSIMIKGLREEKQWSSQRLIREFPQKAWSRTSLDRLLSKFKKSCLQLTKTVNDVCVTSLNAA